MYRLSSGEKIPRTSTADLRLTVENNVLDRRWLEEFGGMLGLRVNDLVGQEGITKKDLIPFTYPTDEELKRVGVTGIFLGYYIPWEGLHNVLVAKAHGFESWGKVVEGDYDDYENLDNYQAGIHEYFKYLKFGFGQFALTRHPCTSAADVYQEKRQ